MVNPEDLVKSSGYNKHEQAVWCNGYRAAQNHINRDCSASINTAMPSNSQMLHLVNISVNVIQSEWDTVIGATATLRSVDGAIFECVKYVEEMLRKHLHEGGACSVVCGVRCGTSAWLKPL